MDMRYGLFFLSFLFISGCSLLQPTGSGGGNSGVKSSGEIGVNVGDIAPNIQLNDPFGREFQLKGLKGKMVLVDFWASWCRPCRAGSPQLVAAHKNYKSKNFKNGSGFEIYSVSLDDNRVAWQAAIEKDGLYWTYHVSDLDGFGSYVVPLYEFNSLPHNVLIDGDGVILKKDLEVHKLDATLKKYLK